MLQRAAVGQVARAGHDARHVPAGFKQVVEAQGELRAKEHGHHQNARGLRALGTQERRSFAAQKAHGPRQQRQRRCVQRKQSGVAQGKLALVDIFQVFPKQQKRKRDAHGRHIEKS